MIRYYKKEDIEQIAKIIDEDWKIVYRGIIDEEYLEKLNYKDREKRIRSKYEKEKAIVYGVRIDIWTHLTRECIINYVH